MMMSVLVVVTMQDQKQAGAGCMDDSTTCACVRVSV